MDKHELADLQNSQDVRGIDIDRVGVKGIKYPISVLDFKEQKQATVADIQLSVNLPHHFKGTHMSRFIEVLNQFRGEMTMRTMPALLNELRDKLDAESAHINIRFPYFVEKQAPVSKLTGLMDYTCGFEGEANSSRQDFILEANIPSTSLCPCSKEISDYGAHNQRSLITIKVRSTMGDDGLPQIIWIEELISIAEEASSAPVYPLLKRDDERWVTMQAYDHPAFVEDILRDIAVALKADARVGWFHVLVENFESIHNHSAFAELEWTR
jgi:GTP cyclohydrolase IB